VAELSLATPRLIGDDVFSLPSMNGLIACATAQTKFVGENDDSSRSAQTRAICPFMEGECA
jgi:hypothetical protein